MKCPACKTPLVVLEHDGVEVDYCVDCRGVWLDAGELDLLFGDREMTRGYLTAGDLAPHSPEAPRICPICDRLMAKHGTAGEPPVLYDQCRSGHGLWFDRGELAAVLEHGSSVYGGVHVAGWLRAMFGVTP
jgi:hypothetical protein